MTFAWIILFLGHPSNYATHVMIVTGIATVVIEMTDIMIVDLANSEIGMIVVTLVSIALVREEVPVRLQKEEVPVPNRP